MSKNTGVVRVAGASSLLAAALVTGSFGVWVHWVSPMFGTAAQTVVRFGLASFIIASIGVLKYDSSYHRGVPVRVRPLRVPHHAIRLVILLGVATFGLGLLYTTAVHMTKIANVMSLLSAGSIITACLGGALFLEEKLTTGKTLAIGVALGGLFMYANGFQEISLGLVVAFGAGACDGMANCLRKCLRRGVDRHSVVLYQYLIAAVLTLPCILLASGKVIGQVASAPILAMLAYAVLSVALGSLLLAGFARLDANVGAVILASQIFFAMLLGTIFLHEFPTTHELIGGVLIFSASFLAVADVGKLLGRVKRSGAVYEPID